MHPKMELESGISFIVEIKEQNVSRSPFEGII
jgi:hypothetical protein